MNSQSKIGSLHSRFSAYKDGDSPILLEGDSGELSFIFVLKGMIECSFKAQTNTRLKLNEMMVVDKTQILNICCKGDTILLEFETLTRMIQLMRSISRTFGMARSEIIPLNKQLHNWSKALLSDLISHPNPGGELHVLHCRTLNSILLDYSKELLGTLYIPLYACSSHCDSCYSNPSLTNISE